MATTEAKQDVGNAFLGSIDTKLTSQATAARQDTGNTSLGNIDGKMTTLGQKNMAGSMPVVLSSDQAAIPVTVTFPAAVYITIVDMIDGTILDTVATPIPGSAANPLEIVASTAARVVKLQTVEDIGEYIGLYTGVALSEVLIAILPLGGGEVEVTIPIATRLSLRSMTATAISVGKMAINFLG